MNQENGVGARKDQVEMEAQHRHEDREHREQVDQRPEDHDPGPVVPPHEGPDRRHAEPEEQARPNRPWAAASRRTPRRRTPSFLEETRRPDQRYVPEAGSGCRPGPGRSARKSARCQRMSTQWPTSREINRMDWHVIMIIVDGNWTDADQFVVGPGRATAPAITSPCGAPQLRDHRPRSRPPAVGFHGLNRVPHHAAHADVTRLGNRHQDGHRIGHAEDQRPEHRPVLFRVEPRSSQP